MNRSLVAISHIKKNIPISSENNTNQNKLSKSSEKKIEMNKLNSSYPREWPVTDNEIRLLGTSVNPPFSPVRPPNSPLILLSSEMKSARIAR